MCVSRAQNHHGPQQDMAHILWMGGSPCSGKSSIAAILAEAYGLQAYHVDDVFNKRHSRRLNPEKQPALCKWINASCDEQWMHPADDLLAEVQACYSEQFGLVLGDLQSLSQGGQLIVEGTALLPDRVCGLLSDQQRAIWVVPTEKFLRAHYPGRGLWVQTILSRCADREQAFENWMNRDAAFSSWIIDRTQALGLELLVVDGSRSIAENAALVAGHFGLT
jgi:2-phosphoglycerate kinase